MSGQHPPSPPRDSSESPLRADEVISQLTEHSGTKLLLGLDTPPQALARLEARGIPERLKKLGFAPLHPEIGVSTPEGQTLRIFHERPAPDRLLMEFKLRIEELPPALTLCTAEPLHRVRLLRIEWALLQNPRATFTEERPRLPDQRFPGLGAALEAGSFLEDLAKDHRCEGLLSFPQHYHNAAIYSRRYVFFHPSYQGMLEAMMRDLKDRSLADRSLAIDAGCLQKAGARAYTPWKASEMLRPLSGRLNEIVRSRFWRREVREYRDGAKWRIDWEAYDRKRPGPPA